LKELTKLLEKLNDLFSSLRPPIPLEQKQKCQNALGLYFIRGGIYYKGIFPAIIAQLYPDIYYITYLCSVSGVTRPSITFARKKLCEKLKLEFKQIKYRRIDGQKSSVISTTGEIRKMRQKESWKKRRREEYARWDKGAHCPSCRRLADKCTCKVIPRSFPDTKARLANKRYHEKVRVEVENLRENYPGLRLLDNAFTEEWYRLCGELEKLYRNSTLRRLLYSELHTAKARSERKYGK
jgi:hypothetical protein